MIDCLQCRRIIAFILSVFMILSVASFPVFAADEEVTEEGTYVLNRDGNGNSLYFYQSACVPSYSLYGYPGAPGTPAPIYIYSMYNSINGDYIPAYCCDITTTAVAGSNYRRLNLEDSYFPENAAGKIRAILNEGFYLVPISGETDDAQATRANAKTAALGQAAGLPEGDLTITEAIAATQAAIWKVVHGIDLEFHTFCRQTLVSNIWSSNTKYASLCNRNTVYHKTNAAINTTIEAVYEYLLSLEPVEAEDTVVSGSSFVDLNDPVFTKNSDGSYDISVTATVDVEMKEGDTLSAKAFLNDSYFADVELENGEQTITLTINNVPESYIEEEITLSVSGYQTAEGYFYFDATGDRGESQAMVGYMNSRLPVYAEVTAKEDRVLNIYKTAKVPVGNGSYVTKPLGGITFAIIPVSSTDDYPEGYNYKNDRNYKPEYVLTTDENGKASFNFLHHGLPDGKYLIIEHEHPDIVAPIEPFYINVPDTTDGAEVYEITIKPKNELKGSVHVEKDVISIGNDSASVNAYENHTWIIGSTVPSDIATGQSYMITDTLDNRLDFLGNVAIVLEKNGDDSPVPLAADTDYIITVTDVDSLSEGKPSDSFKIELTASGMSKIANIIGDNSFNSYMLRVYFNARINANAEMGAQIPNQAEVKYTNASDSVYTEKSDVPVVYTGGINLLKMDNENSNKTLPGAVFEIYRTATQEEVGANDPQLAEIAGVVGKVVKVSFYDNVGLTGDKVTSVTSNENGRVYVYGLAYGKYYLVETKAPNGYNLLGNAVELTIDSTSHTAEKTVTVKNVSGTVLPGTGGPGTAIYTVSGIALLCVALLLICYKKRKATKS